MSQQEPEKEYSSLLESFGFVFMGDCKVCGGTAWLFQKMQGTEAIHVKLKKNSNNFILEKKRTVNGKVPKIGGYGFTKGHKKHIQLVLERNGITKTSI